MINTKSINIHDLIYAVGGSISLMTAILDQDEDNLNKNKEKISENQLIHNVESIFSVQEQAILQNNKKLIEGLKWFFVKNMEIDFSSYEEIQKIMIKNEELNLFYDKLKLNKKLNEDLYFKPSFNNIFKI